MTSSRECGSATLWVLALAGILWFTAFAGMLAGQVRVVRHQAAVAADLAALTAAQRVSRGERQACEAAGRIARANGASLRACVLRGSIADITVEMPLPRVIRSLVPDSGVMMRARAGPSDFGERAQNRRRQRTKSKHST